jgi:putative oxidoreductase
MNALITVLYDWPRVVTGYLAWIGPLAARFVVGWVFLWAGWHKLHDLTKVTGYFADWGFPAPQFMTPLVAGLEFAGGLLLLLGLLTRVVSIPMIIIMIVAIAMVKWKDVTSFLSLIGFEETAYLVMFGWLGLAGPGPVSLDHFILKAMRKERPPSDYGS